MSSEYYNSQFYARQVDGSVRSAKEILQFIYGLYKPLSVVDIGCGRGGWLATAESLGSTKLKGMDGAWVAKENLLSESIDFSNVDLEKDFVVDDKYDLCISVEVAEHLPESRAEQFVGTLCKASDVVLFSAAIKEQGGTNHINEQRQSYWIKFFDANGYDCLDIVRPAIWENEDIQWWYRQNIFLFVRRSADLANLKNHAHLARQIVDIVHPVNYEKRMKAHRDMLQYPTLSFCLNCLRRYAEVKLERLGKKLWN